MDAEMVRHVVDELYANEMVVALILFGSVVRRQARQYSDIDLCIISRTNISESDQQQLLSYGSWGIDLSLFGALPLPIRFRVIREGSVVFCKSPLLLHRIKIDTIRNYLDLAPLIRRHCRHAIGIPR
ncbi:MAG: nucleotidyltransferase domain-containing protein [Methanoregula sp.]|nr:nucleotidyltransferase domain-containing protein [Methanoregula sp.]